MLGPLNDTIHGVISMTWPVVFISAVIMVSTRLCYLLNNKEKIVIYKELMMLIFAIYILCLFQVVTFQDDATWASNNFVPFQEILRYNITSRLFWKNVVGNMLMFLPFGFFVSYYLKVDKIHLPFMLVLVTSLAIEIVQMMIGRVFDVDDIILNLVGGMIGYLIYKVLKRMGERLPKFCSSNWFLNTLMIITLVGFVILLM